MVIDVERLQKKIANSGYTSRRNAEKLILEGKVKVNNVVINELGYKVSDKDEIKIEDVLLEKENKVYYILNKPRGVVSTTDDDKNRKTVVDLINTNTRIYPVGRLDYDTTGLLLLTNDGELANFMTHPKNKIDKVYVAKIKGKLLPNELYLLKNGVVIDNIKTSKSKVKIKSYDYKTDTSIVEITIHEGKNHQVKKMFEKVNHEVLKLKREKVSFLTLDGLKSGEYRPLSIKEVKLLYSMINKK